MPLLVASQDSQTIKELLGHKQVSTTMINNHVLKKGGHGGWLIASADF
jgi:site-specific recombinase XerD